jgi:hypothetical protein
MSSVAIFTDSSGKKWKVNWRGTKLILREQAYNRELFVRSTIRVERLGLLDYWLAGFDPSVSTIQHYETDFKNFRPAVDRHVNASIRKLKAMIPRDGRAAFNFLVSMRAQAETYGAKWNQERVTIAGNTMMTLDKIARNAGAAATIATTVRNVATTSLLVGATVVTGGAGVAAAAAGTAFSYTGQRQDGASDAVALSAAAIDALTVTLIPLGVGKVIAQQVAIGDKFAKPMLLLLSSQAVVMGSMVKTGISANSGAAKAVTKQAAATIATESGRAALEALLKGAALPGPMSLLSRICKDECWENARQLAEFGSSTAFEWSGNKIDELLTESGGENANSAVARLSSPESLFPGFFLPQLQNIVLAPEQYVRLTTLSEAK